MFNRGSHFVCNLKSDIISKMAALYDLSSSKLNGIETNFRNKIFQCICRAHNNLNFNPWLQIMRMKIHFALYTCSLRLHIMHHPVFILGTDAVSSFLRLKVLRGVGSCEPRPTAPSWEPSRSHWPRLLLSSSSLACKTPRQRTESLTLMNGPRIDKNIQIKYIQMKAPMQKS